MNNFTLQEGESEEGAKEGGEEGDEPIDPEKLGDMKRTVQNVQVEEPKIVEEARNKQKEKRNEALEKVKIRVAYSAVKAIKGCGNSNAYSRAMKFA